MQGVVCVRKEKKIQKQNKIRLCAFGIVFVRNLRLDDEKYDNKLRMEQSDGGRRSHSSSTIAARKYERPKSE